MKWRERHPFKCFLSVLMVLVAVTMPATAQDEPAAQLTMAALQSWLDAYGDVWETRDPDAASKLFSEGASYRVTPYEEAHEGRAGIRDYWATVTAGQRNVQFQYELLSVSGSTGIAHWSAQFDVEPDGGSIALDGIFVLDFDEDGKCRRLREWWHLQAEGG